MVTKEILQGSGDNLSGSAYTWDIIAYSGHPVKPKVKKDKNFFLKNDVEFY